MPLGSFFENIQFLDESGLAVEAKLFALRPPKREKSFL